MAEKERTSEVDTNLEGTFLFPTKAQKVAISETHPDQNLSIPLRTQKKKSQNKENKFERQLRHESLEPYFLKGICQKNIPPIGILHHKDPPLFLKLMNLNNIPVCSYECTNTSW